MTVGPASRPFRPMPEIGYLHSHVQIDRPFLPTPARPGMNLSPNRVLEAFESSGTVQALRGSLPGPGETRVLGGAVGSSGLAALATLHRSVENQVLVLVLVPVLVLVLAVFVVRVWVLVLFPVLVLVPVLLLVLDLVLVLILVPVRGLGPRMGLGPAP